MTQELGIWELVLGASIVVQIVMLILVLASITSWFLIFQRTMLMRRTDDELLSFEERFWSGIDLAQLYREGNQAVADGQLPTGVESLFRAGFKEFSRLSQQSDIDADAVSDAPFLGNVPVASLHGALHFDGECDRVDHAGEFHEHSKRGAQVHTAPPTGLFKLMKSFRRIIS